MSRQPILAFLPAPAFACNPCIRPSPGEVLIGRDSTTIPPTPLWEYVEDDIDTNPGPSGYWVERFAAIARGTDTAGAPT